ncbi:hypothetical protein, partial [Acinetobacter indicus]
FCVQASSFENYIAEKAFTDRFVQQSLYTLKNSIFSHIIKICLMFNSILNRYFTSIIRMVRFFKKSASSHFKDLKLRSFN